jgi:transcriptional regulator with XRE-family HTH domain
MMMSIRSTNCYAHIGQTVVKRIMKEKDIKPKEMIERTGIKKTRFYEMYNGTQNPTAAEAEAIAKILDITTGYILQGG